MPVPDSSPSLPQVSSAPVLPAKPSDESPT